MSSGRRTIGAGLLAAVVAVFTAPAASACACGGLASPAGVDITVAQERAFVFRHEGRERIELGLGLLTESVEAGLIFPTPQPAEVSLGSSASFDAVEEAIAPRVVQVDDWWGEFLGGGQDSAGSAGPDTAGGVIRPEVLAQVQLGPIQATTLRAGDAAGLDEWLTANGYRIRSQVRDLLAGYVDRNWYFVALRLTGETELSGGVEPISFTFDSPELVYPFDLARAAVQPQQARLYVFDDHRTRAAPLADPSRDLLFATTYWAGPAPAAFAARGRYLTVLDMVFPDPPRDVPGDLVLPRAPDDAEVFPAVVVHRDVMFLGIRAGWAVVLGVLVLVAVTVVVVRGVHDRRSRKRRVAIRAG